MSWSFLGRWYCLGYSIFSDEINERLKGCKKSKELYRELLFQKIGGFINGESLQFEKHNIRDGFKRELPVPQGIEAETYPPGDHDYGIVVLVKDDQWRGSQFLDQIP